VGCVVCSKEGRKEGTGSSREISKVLSVGLGRKLSSREIWTFECGFGKEGEAQGRFGSFECGFGEMKGKQVYNG